MWKMSNLFCPAVSLRAAFGELYFQHLLVYGDCLALSAETTFQASTEWGHGVNGLHGSLSLAFPTYASRIPCNALLSSLLATSLNVSHYLSES